MEQLSEKKREEKKKKKKNEQCRKHVHKSCRNIRLVDGIPSAEMKFTCMCTVRKQEEEILDTLFSFRFLAIHNWSRSIINTNKRISMKKKKCQEILISNKSVSRHILSFRRFERNVGGKECLTSFIPLKQKLIHETCLETYQLVITAIDVIGREIGLRITRRVSLMEWPAKRWYFYQSWNGLLFKKNKRMFLCGSKKKKKDLFLEEGRINGTFNVQTRQFLINLRIFFYFLFLFSSRFVKIFGYFS